jgi:hypothetical protein
MKLVRPRRGRVFWSDKRASLGMQILNELMKIKNGRGKRVRLISETSLSPRNVEPLKNAAHSCADPDSRHCPRGI